MVQLARTFPQQRFVLDHLGLPDIRAHQFAPWAAGLKPLAACPNVFCKLSGLAYRANWQRWRSGDFTPYLNVALEQFGPWALDGRLQLAGRHRGRRVRRRPGHRVGSGPDVILGEQAQLLGGTCTDGYRLGPHTP